MPRDPRSPHDALLTPVALFLPPGADPHPAARQGAAVLRPLAAAALSPCRQLRAPHTKRQRSLPRPHSPEEQPKSSRRRFFFFNILFFFPFRRYAEELGWMDSQVGRGR